MRSPDLRSSSPHITASGGHIAATLHALAKNHPEVKVEIVNRLRELNSDVSEIEVDCDDAREQLVLRARLPGVDNWLYARSLSEGTLRYIALALLLVDANDRAVLCIEEPENGIHPSRIPNLVNLLRDYAVDLMAAVAFDNPLRQVVLNTHSPEVARQLAFDDFVFVERALQSDHGVVSVFRPITNTWRAVGVAGYLEKDRQAVVDFIGGSVPRSPFDGQYELQFGTAR
jgi:predicted ATPase